MHKSQHSSNNLKYFSRDKPAVLKLLLIISIPISSYLGIIIGLVIPGLLNTIWLQLWRLKLKPIFFENTN